MRLLQLHEENGFSLVERVGANIPPYAILSHTWGADNEEVTFRDLTDGRGTDKLGYRKLIFCGKRTAEDGLEYFWVDTCCIDKSSSAEVSESINSMFRWYQNAVKCYVYLSDVSTTSSGGATFYESRWFTRGWTLQELLAPISVEFFSVEGELLRDRSSCAQEIANITGISVEALIGRALPHFSVEERMAWASKRETTREEDKVYSLLGFFDIHMPLIYGEGHKKALMRLEREIQEGSKGKLPISFQPLTTQGPGTEEMAEEEAVEHVPRVSQAQSEDLCGLLVAVHGQMAQLSNQLNNGKQASHSRSTHIPEEADKKNSEFVESIERLQGVILQEGHVRDEEAEPLISDLECLLSSISILPNDRSAPSLKQGSEVLGEAEEMSSRDLKRLCGIVASSYSISLNAGPSQSKLAKKKKILQTHRVKKIVAQGYKTTVTQNERRYSDC